MTSDPLDREPLCALVGPTASGKTALALEVAERAGAEILSLDSMLVYRGLDVGTAKPTGPERARVRHHLLDLVGPEERYDVQRYLADARAALEEVRARGARALFVGGTGFYLAALLRGIFEGPRVEPGIRAALEARAREVGPAALFAELTARDAASAARLHPNDVRRVVRALEVLEQTGRPLSDWQREWRATPGPRERSARLVGLEVPRAELDARIRARTEAMLSAGWREEALAVRAARGFGPSAAQALGYAEVLAWADGALDREQAAERIQQRTRQFARRQLTWFRKLPIRWLPGRGPPRETEPLAAREKPKGSRTRSCEPFAGCRERVPARLALDRRDFDQAISRSRGGRGSRPRRPTARSTCARTSR